MQNPYLKKTRIGGVVVRVVAWGVVGRGSRPRRVKPKIVKLVFVTYPVRT